MFQNSDNFMKFIMSSLGWKQGRFKCLRENETEVCPQGMIIPLFPCFFIYFSKRKD